MTGPIDDSFLQLINQNLGIAHKVARSYLQDEDDREDLIQEMMYQFNHDYRFDSSRIESAYGVRATSYRDGVTATWRIGA